MRPAAAAGLAALAFLAFLAIGSLAAGGGSSPEQRAVEAVAATPAPAGKKLPSFGSPPPVPGH
jgi:hypothetical protein